MHMLRIVMKRKLKNCRCINKIKFCRKNKLKIKIIFVVEKLIFLWKKNKNKVYLLILNKMIQVIYLN
jgi:hypothetical protein